MMKHSSHYCMLTASTVMDTAKQNDYSDTAQNDWQQKWSHHYERCTQK